MSVLTTYAANNLLNHILGIATFQRPTAVFAGLFVSANEVSGNGYARVQAAFGSSSGKKSLNSANIVFPRATGPWGIINRVGIFDALSGGNLLMVKQLATTVEVLNGDTVVIPMGTFEVTAT